MRLHVRLLFVALFTVSVANVAGARLGSGEVHVWQTQEIMLEAVQDYTNPYAQVECWIDLEGPAFARRVHGFWGVAGQDVAAKILAVP